MASFLIPFGMGLMALGGVMDWHRQRSGQLAGRRPQLRGAGAPTLNGSEAHAEQLREAAVRHAQARGGKGSQIHSVPTLEARVAWIRKGALADSLRVDVVQEARRIVSQKCVDEETGGARWCLTPKNAKEEADALYWAYKNPNSPFAVRYVADHADVDWFGGPSALREAPGADCDEAARRLVGWARAIGFQTRLHVVESTDSPGGADHIWMEVGLPKGAGDKWYALDPTEDYGPGWQVPERMVRRHWIFPI